VTAPGTFADPFPLEFEARFARRGLRLPSPYPDGPPAPTGACPACVYAPCACSTTDEATNLIIEATRFGDDLDLPGWDE